MGALDAGARNSVAFLVEMLFRAYVNTPSPGAVLNSALDLIAGPKWRLVNDEHGSGFTWSLSKARILISYRILLKLLWIRIRITMP